MRRPLLLALLAGVLAVPPVAGQQNAPPLPHPVLLTAFPSGVQAGQMVEITLGGTDLDGATGLLFSAPGLKAMPVPAPPPPAPDPKRPNALKPPPPVVFLVAAADDTPLGIHDVRVVTPLGVSNPRAFVVGDKPEAVEQEPNNDVPEAQRVTLESVVHGVISAPTDVDYYVFAGRKGQRVLAHCQTSSVDSRLDVALELYDAAGRRLAFNRRYSESDALLDADLPADGDYHLRVFGFTYTRGDAQHFYRLTLTAGPWVDAAFPPVIEPGRTADVTFYGRNLPGGRRDPAAVLDGRPLDVLTARVTAPSDPVAFQRLQTTTRVPPRSAGLDGFEYRLRTPAGLANPVLFTYATAPVVVEQEVNDTPETAQALAVPCEVAGRIDRRGDRDWYSFPAKKGDVLVVELFGDRIGAPNDFHLELYDAAGREQRALDDPPNTDLLHPSAFNTHTADPPAFRFTAPADGTYRLLVAAHDAATVAGPASAYRLRLGPERPDFRAVVMPSLDGAPQTQLGPQADALTVPRDGRQYLDVFLWRRDGFAGPVTLTAEGLPPGVTCPPQVVPPNARQAALVFAAAPDASHWAGPVTVIAEAVIDGRKVRREARSATATWPLNQRNVPAVARLDRQLVLAVCDAGPFRLTADGDKLVLRPGETLKLPLRLARDWPDFKATVNVHLLNIPTNVISLNDGQIAADRAEAEVRLTARPSAPAGLYQVVLVGKSQPFPTGRPAARGRPATAAARYPANPLTLMVLPSQVAAVSVTPPNKPLRPGGVVEGVVRVKRQAGYAGALRLHAVLPPGVEGISIPDAELPAGEDSAWLPVHAAADARPGTRRDVVLQATATLEGGYTVTQEAKFFVVVVPK
jgi:hypothetical protein